MAGELVRHLVVELIPAEELAPVLAGGRVKKLPFRRTTTRVRRLGLGFAHLRPQG